MPAVLSALPRSRLAGRLAIAARAWLVEPTVLYGAGLSQGDAVRATVSPRLGHVFSLAQSPMVPAGG